MTHPRPPLPGPPRPGPPHRPHPAAPVTGPPHRGPDAPLGPGGEDAGSPGPRIRAAEGHDGTGHPAVDAALRSLANAVPLAPSNQIAAYEAAHRVLQETLSSIDQS